jgi:hypothetical protein
LHGKSAELIVVRMLTNGGKTLVLTQTLNIEGGPDGPLVRRIWHRRSES